MKIIINLNELFFFVFWILVVFLIASHKGRYFYESKQRNVSKQQQSRWNSNLHSFFAKGKYLYTLL